MTRTQEQRPGISSAPRIAIVSWQVGLDAIWSRTESCTGGVLRQGVSIHCQCRIRAQEPGASSSNLKITTNAKDCRKRQLERYEYLANAHSVKYHFHRLINPLSAGRAPTDGLGAVVLQPVPGAKGALMAWTWGSTTLAPGQSQRWWLSWSGYPGFEVIGADTTSNGAEIDCSAPGMQNQGTSTLYWLTVRNVGSLTAQFAFTGSTGPSWTWGNSVLGAGQSQRWWLWWPTYPGLEIIGVQSITPGVEIDYDSPGMQSNADGSATYFITVTNVSSSAGQYHFVGLPIC